MVRRVNAKESSISSGAIYHVTQFRYDLSYLGEFRIQRSIVFTDVVIWVHSNNNQRRAISEICRHFRYLEYVITNLLADTAEKKRLFQR